MEDHRDGDGDDRRPASRRVADELRAAIESGVYPAGTALPPLRQLAARHGVAINTAMAAVRILGDEGYVISKPNAGSYVRDRNSPGSPAQELRWLRVEVGQLRTRVRQLDESLAGIEARLSGLSGLVALSDDQAERSET